MRRVAVATLAAALCAACGGNNPSGSHNVDSVTLSLGGAAPVTFTDDAANVAILVMSGVSSNTLLSLDVTGGAAVNFQLSLPAGATGPAVSGQVSRLIISGYSCTGAVTVNVTSHGTSSGSLLAGSFGPATLACTSGSLSVSGSFTATHL